MRPWLAKGGGKQKSSGQRKRRRKTKGTVSRKNSASASPCSTVMGHHDSPDPVCFFMVEYDPSSAFSHAHSMF